MFHAKVKGRVFRIFGIDYITSGSVGLQIDFEFDDEWTGLERYATFEAGSVSISVELENDACVIPWEVLEDPNVNLRIGIRGSNGDDVVIPTIWREYEIHEGAEFSEDSGSPASLSVIEQLSARMDALEESGGVDIFWATYGQTSFDDVYQQADIHRRLVACRYNDRIYILQKDSSSGGVSSYTFYAPDFDQTNISVYWVKIDEEDFWTNGYKSSSGGGGGTSDVFFATYDVTTSAEIAAAYNAGKAVYVIHGEYAAPLFEIYPNDDYAVFGATNGQNLYAWECDTDVWSRVVKTVGTYSKPAGGIPITDLSQAVQHTLNNIPTPYVLTPQMDGAGSAGSSAGFARGDHQHPSDTSKADAWGYEEISDDGAVTQALDARKVYFFSGALTALTITLGQATAPAQYHFIFDGEPTLTMPNTVVMPDGFQVDASKHYEIDILTVDGVNYFGTAQSW